MMTEDGVYLLDRTFQAEAALTGANVVVSFSTTSGKTDMIVLTGTTNARVAGVLMEITQASGGLYQARVRIHGIAFIKSAGSAIAGGDKLYVSDAYGRVAPMTVAYAGSNVISIVGIALDAVAGTANLLVPTLLTPGCLAKP